jgi:hypothetical protein
VGLCAASALRTGLRRPTRRARRRRAPVPRRTPQHKKAALAHSHCRQYWLRASVHATGDCGRMYFVHRLLGPVVPTGASAITCARKGHIPRCEKSDNPALLSTVARRRNKNAAQDDGCHADLRASGARRTETVFPRRDGRWHRLSTVRSGEVARPLTLAAKIYHRTPRCTASTSRPVSATATSCSRTRAAARTACGSTAIAAVVRLVADRASACSRCCGRSQAMRMGER